MPVSVHEKVNLEYVEAEFRDEIVRVEFESITHFMADEKYVSVFHSGGELLLRTPLKELVELYGDRLVRVHRNALVVRSRIKCFRPVGYLGSTSAFVTLDAPPSRVVVSRRHIKPVRELVRSMVADKS